MTKRKPKRPTDDAMREAARRLFEKEGTLEIDDAAPVSRAPRDPDKGAYVQAWVWVYNDDAKRETDHA